MVDDKIGCLIMNIGTPSDPTIKGIRSYLREFLSDPEVIDTNPIIRWAIVNLFVAPFRPKAVLPQYQSIWTKNGSPLLVNSCNFLKEIANKNPNIVFELGMRYGEPSIEHGLIKLKKAGVKKIILFPMFPQYAQATSGSCINKAIEIINKLDLNWKYEIIEYFYNKNFFIDNIVKSISESNDYHESEFLLFSFHGLPQRHVKKIDLSNNYCLVKDKCCETISKYNQICYSHHCFETVSRVIKKLNPDKPYDISFQSRFGLDAWLQPNTTDIIEKLAKKGIKKISVICPAFIFDCLETLEEIAIRNNEYFKAAGGDQIKLIPSLNYNPEWVTGLSKYMNEKFA
ncbi:MAG: ferrochelatase [Chloroflexi bacterium]|nr:ferrochelatase [Chloroflexota bacterium]MQG05495.1 ferrochelatase [SAR202 cluster bacterium]